MFPGDPRELVRIDMTLSDETFALTDPLPRVDAERVLRDIGQYDMQPAPHARVVAAILRPLVP